jgi:hypothetical protein
MFPGCTTSSRLRFRTTTVREWLPPACSRARFSMSIVRRVDIKSPNCSPGGVQLGVLFNQAGAARQTPAQMLADLDDFGDGEPLSDDVKREWIVGDVLILGGWGRTRSLMRMPTWKAPETERQ